MKKQGSNALFTLVFMYLKFPSWRSTSFGQIQAKHQVLLISGRKGKRAKINFQNVSQLQNLNEKSYESCEKVQDLSQLMTTELLRYQYWVFKVTLTELMINRKCCHACGGQTCDLPLEQVASKSLPPLLRQRAYK